MFLLERISLMCFFRQSAQSLKFKLSLGVARRPVLKQQINISSSFDQKFNGFELLHANISPLQIVKMKKKAKGGRAVSETKGSLTYGVGGR